MRSGQQVAREWIDAVGAARRASRGRSQPVLPVRAAQGTPNDPKPTKAHRCKVTPPACPDAPVIWMLGVMLVASTRRYPLELKQRAVRMVAEIAGEHESEWAAMGLRRPPSSRTRGGVLRSKQSQQP